eukprot:scaffold9713_cov103-Isochrysis_galbana.AAC.6
MVQQRGPLPLPPLIFSLPSSKGHLVGPVGCSCIGRILFHLFGAHEPAHELVEVVRCNGIVVGEGGERRRHDVCLEAARSHAPMEGDGVEQVYGLLHCCARPAGCTSKAARALGQVRGP